MFNLKRALLPINGQTFSDWNVVKFALADIVWDNRKDLFSGFSAKDLFTLALEHGLIKHDRSGSIKVGLDVVSIEPEKKV